MFICFWNKVIQGLENDSECHLLIVRAQPTLAPIISGQVLKERYAFKNKTGMEIFMSLLTDSH